MDSVHKLDLFLLTSFYFYRYLIYIGEKNAIKVILSFLAIYEFYCCFITDAHNKS